jgi:polysaccharide export outer membrane protein
VPAPEPPTRTTLASDDVLRVVVYGHPELSSPEEGTRIDYEGNVSLPLVGAVRVAGGTVTAATSALEEAASRVLRRPSVAVSVIEYAPRTFTLLGEVQQTGRFDLDRPLTALSALSLGGGFREGADREQVALLRVENDELSVHFFDAATPGPDGYVPVRPDDVLFVRLSGAGTFREQMMPYLQGISSPLGALASLIVVTDRLNQ